MKKSTKIFLLLSLLIALSNLMLVTIANRNARQTLQEHFLQKGRQIENGIRLNLDATGLRMQQIAMFVASDPRFQQEFLAGKRAVNEEGGGAGGPKAAQIRTRLLELTKQSQSELAKHYDFRQLHFHFGPGSTSFLRVHQPEKFGDNMDDVRHTVVFTNRTKQPTTGFETGRIFPGIRGVAPVFATDPETGKDVHVGAVEAGTSFFGTIQKISNSQHVGIAVLLKMSHMRETVWPEYLQKLLEKNPSTASYMVEETTSPQVNSVLNTQQVKQHLEGLGTLVCNLEQHQYAVTIIPLRDFLGERDPSRPDVGRLLVWYDATPQFVSYQKSQKTNFAMAALGFCLIEALLFLGIRTTTAQLEKRIQAGKFEILEKNKALERDILRRKRVEQNLKLRDVQLRQLFEEAIYGIGLAEPKTGKIIDCNTAFCKMLKRDKTEIIGKPQKEFHPADEQDGSTTKTFQLHLKEKSGQTIETKMLASTGETLDVEIRAKLIDLGENQLVQGFFKDVTAQKKAEADAAERRAEFEAIFNSILDAVVLVDAQRKIILTNPAFSEMFGYQFAEVAGKTTQMLYANPADYLTQGKTRFNPESPIKAPVFMVEYRRKDGSTFPGETLGAHVANAHKGLPGFLGVIRDRSEDELAEQTLREKESTLNSILRAAPIGIGLTQDRIIKWASQNLLTMVGYSHEELIGQNSIMLYGNEEEFQRVGQVKYEEIAKTGTGSVETRFKKQDGTYLDVLLSSTPLDTSDLSVGVIFAAMDITKHKLAEREKVALEAHLHQAHKMEAIGTMAGGIAHDFNNLLSIINGNLDIIQRNAQHVAPSDLNFEHINMATQRASELIKQILAYSRQEKHELIPVDLSAAASDALRLLRSTLPSSIDINSELEVQSIYVNADETQLQQVIINLCTNAVHAMQEKGLLQVRLDEASLTTSDFLEENDRQAGRYARLTITDTGCGIDTKTMKKIFDPFFTTKPVGIGTGMGLAVVHGIVQQHGGFIRVTSKPGEGTTFKIYFPVIERPASTPDSSASTEPMPTGTEHILLVDDEESIAYTCNELLSFQGYKVTSFSSSVEALHAFRANPDEFDLVLTDQTMPEMSGVELSQELLRLRPDIPIILCSGYSTSVSENNAKQMGIREFCLKPLNMKQLAIVVRQVLDHKTSDLPPTDG